MARLAVTATNPDVGLHHLERWDSLDDAPLSPAQSVELERRLASLDDDVAEAVTWDELKADLAARAS